MTTILHITTLGAWEEARAVGVYRSASLETEGFIHFSTPEQVTRVADSFYRGQRGLVLLDVDPARLTARLRWEPPAHPAPAGADEPEGARFPHLYGPLNLDAVVRVREFPPREDGTFSLPPAD